VRGRRRRTHTELDEVDRAGKEAADGDAAEDADEPERVAVEGEPAREVGRISGRASRPCRTRGAKDAPERLGEQHRAHKGALGRVEAGAEDHGRRLELAAGFGAAEHARRRLADADDLGAVVDDVPCEVGVDLAGLLSERRRGDKVHAGRLDRVLRDGHRLARQHRLVDDGVAGEEEEVGGERVERGVGQVEDVARDERGRVVGHPCERTSESARADEVQHRGDAH